MNIEILGIAVSVLLVIIGQTSYFAYKMGAIEKTLKVLEEKQDRHNGIVAKVYCNERDIAVIQEQIKVGNHRIEDLEGER